MYNILVMEECCTRRPEFASVHNYVLFIVKFTVFQENNFSKTLKFQCSLQPPCVMKVLKNISVSFSYATKPQKVYIGETGRQLGTRITEHRKEAEKISNRNFTRTTRRASTNEHHKSAITDHVCQNNHIMNWEASEIVEQDGDKFKRWIKESICIRSNTPTMMKVL